MSTSSEIPRSDWHNDQSPIGLFICDFDGTLLRSDRSFSNDDLEALKRLGELGIARAVATGRSVYSINTIPISTLPVDFLIFSSGAGINRHPDGLIIRKTGLEAHQVRQAIQILQAHQLDFMVHRPIPDNHAFSYFESTSGNADFNKRIEPVRSESNNQAYKRIRSRSREALATLKGYEYLWVKFAEILLFVNPLGHFCCFSADPEIICGVFTT